MTTKYEMHVNGYKIGDSLESKLVALGFYRDPFLQTENRHTPKNHFTFEVFGDPKTHNSTWIKALQVVKDDEEFQGYIEAETVPEDYSTKFEEIKPYSGRDFPFPLPVCKTIEVPVGKHKAADIHVKRGLDLPKDELDKLLLSRNFYEVHTPRNRIFTFQTEWFGDAKEAYKRLYQYFLQAGGVKQVDLEITSKLYRNPKNFPLAKIVPRGHIVNS